MTAVNNFVAAMLLNSMPLFVLITISNIFLFNFYSAYPDLLLIFDQLPIFIEFCNSILNNHLALLEFVIELE